MGDPMLDKLNRERPGRVDGYVLAYVRIYPDGGIDLIVEHPGDQDDEMTANLCVDAAEFYRALTTRPIPTRSEAAPVEQPDPLVPIFDLLEHHPPAWPVRLFRKLCG